MTVGSSAPIARYCAWVEDIALPRWAGHGFDAARGRFWERLDKTASPVDTPFRAMVQARQIYVFADAARSGWCAAGGLLAERAMASFLRDFGAETRDQLSFAFSVDQTGSCVSPVRDAYAHAFALFSLAALYRLNGDRSLLRLADKTIAFIEQEMTDSQHGGLFDALPATTGGKRQNPHMHLLEAYLFLHEAAPDRGYLDRAAKIVTLFESRLFDPATGKLLEYFEDDWSPHREAERAIIWEPGHHFEWVWLLDQFARATCAPLSATAQILQQQAMRHGFTSSGMLADEVGSVDNKVLRGSSRIWPHTEAIKSAATFHSMGERQAAPQADAMATVLLEHFLDRTFSGGWTDHVSTQGAPLVEHVPASSLYHLYLAATEASNAFRTSERRATIEQTA